MARKALTETQLSLVQAIHTHVSVAGTRAADFRDGTSTSPVTGMVVALSGGRDSLTLSRAASVVSQRWGIGCRCVSVNHQLQAGSGEVALRAVAQSAQWGVAGEVVTVTVGTGGGMEAAARTARYDALQAAVQPGEIVLLGHTLDDQAETVLLGLARGSGIRSLSGMPVHRGVFVRPWLDIRRDQVALAAQEWGIHAHQDPHNNDRRFARVRARLDVLPLLEDSLGPRIAEALARTAHLARADADLLDSWAREFQDPADCVALQSLPDPIRRRVLMRWLASQGATDVALTHVVAVDELVLNWHGQRGVDLPQIRVERVDGRLRADPHRVDSNNR